MTIKGLYRKVEAVVIPEVAREAFIAVENDYAEENKKQLFDGFDKFGEHLLEYKSFAYAEQKNFLNPIPGFGNPDLFVTGEFTNSRKVTMNGDEIVTTFSDPKAPDLLERDPDINGLGGTFKAEFITDNLRPSFMSVIKKKTGL